jgi:hypothetical protein
MPPRRFLRPAEAGKPPQPGMTLARRASGNVYCHRDFPTADLTCVPGLRNLLLCPWNYGLPETHEKTEMFKGFIHAIQTTRTFAASGITLDRQDITEVRTRDHVLLQCLDTVLGAMAFRLNDKHKQKLPGSRIRGRRTRAKEALCRFMLGEIRGPLPGFNIGVTTGSRGDPVSRWNQPYRHWCFQPKASVFDGELTKR